MPDTHAERQRRYRERRAPVPRYAAAVVAWDERVQTPTSGRLALLASDILDAWERRGTGKRSLAELMGIGKGLVRLTDASRVAQRGLERALAEIAAPDVSDASVRAGLHHAKRLATAPTTVSDSTALFRAMLGPTGGYAPSHLLDPLSGEVDPDDERDQ
jgi:hypothetical protein